ncbi:MAG: EAL domain-containing protein [Oscillospiraceae bacterium]
MKKKIIGVCLTRISERIRAEYVKQLNICAKEHGFKIIVFNSVVDFYYNDSFDVGARSIYSDIHFDLLDAMIIFDDMFKNKDIVREIISNAKAKNVPVLMANAEYNGCFSVKRDYIEPYIELMCHVIREHNVTDTFFIAGRQNADPDSVTRIDCYKQALERCGLSYSEDNVDYGEYWELPTRKVVERLLMRAKLPQAIFCANDYMAIAVCESFKQNGISVPQDVIVTGFDGVPEADYFTPHLTTCCEDIPSLAKLHMDIILQALDGAEPAAFKNTYVNIFSESCGCKDTHNFADDSRQLFHYFQSTVSHETFVMSLIDRMCAATSFITLKEYFSKCILPNSYICFFSDFMDVVSQSSYIGKDQLFVVSERYDDATPNVIGKAGFVPNFEEWLEDDSVYVLTASYVGSMVCGYYAARLGDIDESTQHIDRIVRAINIGLSTFTSILNRMNMERSLANAQTHNIVSRLPNLRAANEWFNDFSSAASNHKLSLTVSVYCLQQYKNIYEVYGFKEAEEAIRVIAQALRNANRTNCYIAQLSDDEFVVVNYYRDASLISDTINSATAEFYKQMGEYNSSSGKEFFVEVNCGCTVVNPGWKGSLDSFTKLATAELYINRMNHTQKSSGGEKTVLKDFYPALNALIEKNLFIYHFQPIINARNGEIFAYEALMRTDPSVGMNPMQVLETAEAYKRLYDIERATMFNVMERFDREYDSFFGRKVFINSIPGYFLNDSDANLLSDKFSHHMSSFVFELTEQNAVSEEELNILRHFGNEMNFNQIAIDDYGTGHSNIVNLLRYSPQIIKIDRFLISDINSDTNKQMFVKSTIDFARMNGIKVLAEGVETAEELKTVVGFGVDYIQGYYTGKPQFTPLEKLPDAIREEILKANTISTE